MAFVHGKNAGLMIEDGSTTKRNISQYLNSIDFSRSADTAEVTTFNTTQNAKVYVPGLKDASFSVEGKWDLTPDKYLYDIVGTEKAFTFYPNSTKSTNTTFVRYSGNAICTSYSPPASVDSEGTFSAEFQPTGAITRSTASS